MNLKNITCQVFCIFLISLFSAQIVAQDESEKPSRWLLRFDAFHQDNLININAGALGVYDKVLIRPGAALSAEYAWYQNNRVRLFSTVKTSYHFNTYEERTASLGSETGMDIRLFKAFYVAPKFGIHGAYVQPTDVQYVFEGGKWEKADRKGDGFSRFIFNLGIDLAYRVKKGDRPIDIVVNSTGLIGSPYVPDSSLNIWVWASAGIGVRVGI